MRPKETKLFGFSPNPSPEKLNYGNFWPHLFGHEKYPRYF
jgi:hypothetical protein